MKRLPTPEEVTSWKGHGGPWGMPCGALSGFVVLDFDVPEGPKLFESRYDEAHLPPTALTPRGGYHALHTYQEGITVPNDVKLIPGLDVRSEGGYVIIPSAYQDGRTWVQEPNGTSYPLPAWFLEALKNKASQPSSAPMAEIAGLPRGVGKGERNATAARLAGRYIHKGLNAEETFHVLRPWATTCEPPFPDAELRSVVFSIARKEQVKEQTTDVDNPAVAIGPKAPLFASLSTLLASPRPQRWLVKGLIEAPSTVMIFGPSGCGKTFIAADLAGATATDGVWCGRQVSGGPVYYIVGEGRIPLLRRFQAWQLKRKVRIPEDRLFLSVVPIELNASGAAEVALEAERRAQESSGPPALIVVDTLSRAMPAGDDENSVKDMMGFVKAVDQIRDRFDCVAVIVHHAGVADDKRARGSTSLKAAMDAELCITKRGPIRTAEWTKLKDLPEEPHPQEFALEPELLGQDEDGNLITSAVVAWKGRTALKTTTSTTKAENLGLETLRGATATGEGPVSVEAWRFVFYSRHWGEDNASKRKAFARVRESLAGKGLIRIDDGNYSIPIRGGAGG